MCDLGIAREAAELHGASDVIDLHVDTFIWTRLFGYDLTRRHGPGPLPGWCARQVDLPRLVDAGVGGAVWAITTNPFANGDELRDGLLANLERLTSLLNRSGAAVVVRTPAEYRKARLTGRHGAFLALQGGNALAYDLDLLERLPGDPLVLVTLVHMTDSDLGATSSPLRLGPDRGLSRRGRDLVDALEARRILVDLAHIGRRGFWNAVDMHDRTRPLIVSHTGASGIHPHWRNLDDAQLRAIADSGGTVGIIYHASYLGDPLWRGRALSVVRHLEHVIETVGEDHASLGSDWDGLIVTPRDLRTASELPRLTALLLRRGHSPERVRKLLGGNFLRVLGEGR
ncbi:MAG: membrane dipeptidase [Polyangiaceae bacterium]|nr:membrane dipeptidase [Polyangiaceae bacterium]